MLHSACQLDSACFFPFSLVCLPPCCPPPLRSWQLKSALELLNTELGPLMPVMVEDYINGSFCHCHIGVNGKAARLPERDKGYIFRFTCSLSSLSLHTKHTLTHAHTYTSISMCTHTRNIHIMFRQIQPLNICCLFEVNCSFTRVSSDVHLVIVKSASVATSFEVGCGLFVQGQTHT